MASSSTTKMEEEQSAPPIPAVEPVYDIYEECFDEVDIRRHIGWDGKPISPEEYQFMAGGYRKTPHVAFGSFLDYNCHRFASCECCHRYVKKIIRPAVDSNWRFLTCGAPKCEEVVIYVLFKIYNGK